MSAFYREVGVPIDQTGDRCPELRFNSRAWCVLNSVLGEPVNLFRFPDCDMTSGAIIRMLSWRSIFGIGINTHPGKKKNSDVGLTLLFLIGMFATPQQLVSIQTDRNADVMGDQRKPFFRDAQKQLERTYSLKRRSCMGRKKNCVWGWR